MLLVHTKVLANIYSTLTAEHLPRMHVCQFSQIWHLQHDKTIVLVDRSYGPYDSGRTLRLWVDLEKNKFCLCHIVQMLSDNIFRRSREWLLRVLLDGRVSSQCKLGVRVASAGSHRHERSHTFNDDLHELELRTAERRR